MAEYVRKEEIPVTKQDKTVLVEGLKKLSADVADLAARLEGSEAPKDTQDEPAVEQAPAPTEAAPTETCTYEETRAVLAEKSRAGFRAEVKALLAEFGVSQLSDVKDPGKLAEIVKKAEGIGNA
jgi:hypothetical protein